METETKFCKDCEWYHKINIPREKLHYCYSPKVIKKGTLDVVLGFNKLESYDCYIIRLDENLCGQSGKYWEQKEIEPEAEKTGFWKWFFNHL